MPRVTGLIALSSVLGFSVLSGSAPAASDQRVASAPAAADDRGLCRRAPLLAPLPPERRPQRRRSAFESRDLVTAPSPAAPEEAPPADAPPPPPPPLPPPSIAPPPIVAAPAAPSSADTIVTTAARARASDPRAGSAFVPRTPPPGPRPQSGLLTAGEHDDLLNPELYAAYADAFLAREPLPGVPRVDTARVLTVSVRDAAGRPVPLAPVTLTCADGNRLTLATAANGEAVFFPALDRLGSGVTLGVPGASARRVALSDGPGAIRQTVVTAGPAAPVRQFDLALALDATGSMGDEIRYLQSELRSIVDRVRARHPGLDIRVGLVVYRDEGDEFVTRTYPFTRDLAAFQRALAAQSADGGGDEPEAVEQAMARAAALDWRPGAVKSLLLVADAPPHAEDVPATWAATEALRARRVHIVPVAASGVADGAEYVMRAMAAATQSSYLFLTDDSGVGDPHAPPAIDCYRVTRLDAALRRVLDAQIGGRRVEAEPAEVIRTVGTYDNGRCVLPPDFGRRSSQ